MMNELIFFVQAITVGTSTMLATRLGKEAVVALITVQCVLANVFVLKQTTLFGFTAVCSDAFTIGATLGLNVLQERWGQEIAKRTVWINFFALLFYAIVSRIHLAYVPSIVDDAHQHYAPLLQFMPRIVVASFVVYFIAQTVDYTLFGILKRVCKDRFFILRNAGSALVSQFVDTVLFTFAGLYGIIDNPWQVIAVSYTVKVVAMFVIVPLVRTSSTNT